MKPLILCAVLLIGAVQIHSIYYDAYSESNSEYVMLANTGSEPINLTGYTLATPTSQQDATLAGIIESYATFLIADDGWNTQRDNLSWPEADYLETLTLPNSAGFVQLIDANETLLDTVGWADTEIFLGGPHPGTDQGFALVRISDTDHNAEDFEQQLPAFETLQEYNATDLRIIINESEPEILNYSFADESPHSQRIELTATPGKTTYLHARIQVQDLNTIADVQVHVNEQEFSTNDTGTIGNFSGTIPITTRTTNVDIRIADQEHEVQITLPVTLADVLAVSIPENITLHATPGEHSYIDIPITNTGTQEADIHLRASIPQWAGALIGEITYQLAGANHTLTDDFVHHDIGLQPQETTLMRVQMTGGYVPANEYLGKIFVVAVRSQ